MIHGAVAAAALLALGVANAAGPSKSHAGGASKAESVAPSAVLYDQNDNDLGSGFTSQNFEVTFDAYDSQAADDFTVPAGSKWLVTSVTASGVYYNGTGPMASAHVTFYKNKAGSPSAMVADIPAAAISSDVAGSVVVTFPKVTLKPGTYWVSVQANMDFGVGGQWGWEARSLTAGNLPKWQNPLGGFGVGCTTWSDMGTCLGASVPDLMFAIGGKAKPI